LVERWFPAANPKTRYNKRTIETFLLLLPTFSSILVRGEEKEEKKVIDWIYLNKCESIGFKDLAVAIDSYLRSFVDHGFGVLPCPLPSV
jgi:hypothetical protein